MSNYPQRVFNQVLDTLFPRVCLGCDRFTTVGDFDYVCKKCFGGIDLKNSLECIGCKRQTRLGLTCIFCKKENEIDQLLIAAELSDRLIDKMLKFYKYKFISDMYKPLSVIAKKSVKRLLSKGFNVFEDNPLLVPVPLYKVRLNERGFNQSQLLAKEIADTFHMSCVEDVLFRKHNTKNQADTKSKEERLNNMKESFTLVDRSRIDGRTIILVDDICTTGATLNECAKVLKNPPAGGGAKRVIGFVIARG